jgi:hypothetical protein
MGRAYLAREELPEDATEHAQFVVQPNFDVIVPVQELDPLLTAPLEQFAERVSSGQVTVYRLSKESFTRAVQEGHDGAAFTDYLLAHNKGGSLPDNVLATLETWRGGLKRVRLRTITIAESEDGLVMADLMHRRRLRKFFTPIDPAHVVALDGISKAELSKELEREGFVID